MADNFLRKKPFLFCNTSWHQEREGVNKRKKFCKKKANDNATWFITLEPLAGWCAKVLARYFYEYT